MSTERPAPILSEPTIDHLRRGHPALHKRVDELDIHEVEYFHDGAHHNTIYGRGGNPPHAHTDMSGVCEMAIHDECTMRECDCPCHKVPA